MGLLRRRVFGRSYKRSCRLSDYYVLWHESETAQPVGTLEVNIESDLFNFQLNSEYSGEVPWFVSYAKDAVLPMNTMIKMWVLDRAPESHNEFIDSLIRKANLDEYDAYGFFKYNKGKFITDRFYVVECEKSG